MAVVKDCETIGIHFAGKFEEGSVFDTSEGGASLELKLGNGEFIKGLEEGVIGMEPGGSKTLYIPAEKAYGLRKEEMVFEFGRSKAPDNFEPEIGQQMQLYRADGAPVAVAIIGKSEHSLTMDCNNRLAGKNLIFDITLEEIL